MRITVRSLLDPQREIDVTGRLVAAIAKELWKLYRGNALLNRADEIEKAIRMTQTREDGMIKPLITFWRGRP
jgi:hypothetical protein